MFDPRAIYPEEDPLVIERQEKKETGVSYVVNYEKARLAAGKRTVFRLTDTCDTSRDNERHLQAVSGPSDGKYVGLRSYCTSTKQLVECDWNKLSQSSSALWKQRKLLSMMLSGCVRCLRKRT